MKTCPSCKLDKDTTEFYKASKEKDGHQHICKACYKAKHNSPEQTKTARLKALYGITKEQYDEMLKSQFNLCAICELPFDVKTKPHVDHDHKTGRVRGLLCVKCNTGLGMFEDSQQSLLKAVSYLRLGGV